MKKIILSLVVCSLFTFGNMVDDYHSEGMSAYRAGDYPKSLKNFKSALEIQLKTLPKDGYFSTISFFRHPPLKLA